MIAEALLRDTVGGEHLGQAILDEEEIAQIDEFVAKELSPDFGYDAPPTEPDQAANG